MLMKFSRAVLLPAVSAIVVMSFAVLSFAQPATATPQLTLKMTAEKEVKTVKDGKETVEMVPAKALKAGESVLYRITYTNAGNSDAFKVVISDPIPKDMVYMAGSAKGANSDITFSIDGGRKFSKTPRQVIKTPAGKKEEKDASPEMYTDIKWTVKKIAPKESGSVTFMARVK